MLLPRLIPFGEIDNDEMDLVLTLTEEEGEIPPALSPMRRRFLLSKLILSKSRAEGIEEMTPEKALQLADALSAFLDQAYIEQMPFDCLSSLVPEEFASHWQDVLLFLETVTYYWPEILHEHGVMDPADRQVRLFKRQAEIWRETPSLTPVIAAGSTGSQPATAELLDVIAGMPAGKVILPGLDMIAEEKTLKAVDPSHPQYNMINLLKRMGISRQDVKEFGEAKSHRNTERLRLISEAMRPAETSDAWRTITPFSEKALEGLTRLDCDSVQEESLVIALILRHVLEIPGKTAAVVTPDRSLARRIISEMSRWGILLDDSAGTPFPHMPLGAFLNLLAEAALSNLAPYELLACLKHPLAAGGMGLGAFRTLVRRLELSCLRGSRPGDGCSGLLNAVKDDETLSPFVQGISEAIGDFVELMQSRRPHGLETYTEAHLKAAENLARSADRTGAERLWTGEAGEAAVTFFNQLRQDATLMEELTPGEYLSVLNAMMSKISVRPTYGMHPRIDILGTIEARLIQPDVLILAGLNEDSWPQTLPADPWLSRPMRQECGLPSPERKIGLSAHDFAQAFCAPNVFITRSMKDSGTPTVPSRWLMRLDAVIGSSGLSWPEGDWLSWARLLDRREKVKSIQAPAPTPPVNTRPRKLSVTQIETWMRDPYSIYARHILNLRPLDEIDQELNLADFGNLMHHTLEQFCRKYPSSLPVSAREEILEIGRSFLKMLNFSAKAKAFWQPRMERALLWFIDRQEERIDSIDQILCEQKGSIILPYAGGDFELFGYADRLDILKEGTVAIIDYKTGLPPAVNSVKNGFSPQLPLEAGMILRGGFENVKAKEVSSLEYWRLKSREEGGFIRNVSEVPAETAAYYFNILEELVETFDKPETPYMATPDSSISKQYNEYEHLARMAEWVTFDAKGEGEGDGDG